MAKAGENIWRDVGKVIDFTEERCYHLYAEIGVEHDVVLFHYNGLFHAMQNSCQHMGGPLSQATDIEEIDGQPTISCPWHGYKYNIKTGISLVCDELRQETFEVLVDRGRLHIKHKYRLSRKPWPPLVIK
ncbi:Rieske domain-containing protein-like [Tubulanus polymorphus]|uniref:Rieske domain-containing protein-like n=1 Tax=Tubulanus polymorphus TaxID=672921 RepID=UPI003DA64ABC